MKRGITAFILTGGILLMLITRIFGLGGEFINVGGNWQNDGAVITGSNKSAPDCFCMSDTYAEAGESIVLSCKFTFDGHAVGLVLAKDRGNPSDDWFCINYEPSADIARLFHVVGGALVTSSPVTLTPESKSAPEHNFRIVYDAGGQMSFYADDLLAGSVPAADFTGGYAGVMTCFADGSFSELELNALSMPEIKSLTVDGVQLTPEYSPETTDFVGYVSYETDRITLAPVYEEGIIFRVNGKEVASGESESVRLGIGYNKIKLEKTCETVAGKTATVQYLNIHRAQSEEYLYHEDYRPMFHYSSAAEWINDPNGLCYDAATGLYHMFYQTRPRTSASEPNQCWYHAVSTDLNHWKQIDPALVPDKYGYCWSGSGNIDYLNTSGLFPADSAPESRIVLAFSSYAGDTEFGVEKISLAYSVDAGKTFKTVECNPIIKNGSDHVQEYNDGFRDPKLLWFEDESYKNGGVWLMLVGGGQGRIFSSDNLLDWKFESAMTDRDGSPLHGECPDFFKIKVEGTDEYKWVYMRGYLDLNTTPMIFQTRPVVGDLHKNADGVFVFEVEADTKQIMYGGNTLYATQSFAQSADGRRIQISWYREWLEIAGTKVTAAHTKDWNGLMSLPLELKLFRTDGQYTFTSYPIKEVGLLRGDVIFEAADVTSVQANGKYTEAEIELIPDGNDCGFVFREGKNGGMRVTVTDYDKESGTVTVTADGSKSGKINGDKASVVANTVDGKLKLRIYIDANCVDVFCGDGEKSVFALGYPDPDSTGISYFGTANVEKITVWEMKSCFGEPDIPVEPVETTRADNSTASDMATDVATDTTTSGETTKVTDSKQVGYGSAAGAVILLGSVTLAGAAVIKRKRKIDYK